MALSTSTEADRDVNAGLRTISHDELVRALAGRRITLIDVLSPESYAAAHIPGAINLPVVDIPRRAPERLVDRHAPLVTYCGGPT